MYIQSTFSFPVWTAVPTVRVSPVFTRLSYYAYGVLAAPAAGGSARLSPALRYTAHHAVTLCFVVTTYEDIREKKFALN
jgi:hypothetical protein